jgi:hypothetical protein
LPTAVIPGIVITAPEIAVSRGSAIADGGTDSLGGGQTAGTPIALTYTISNTGNLPLTLTPPGTLGSSVNCTVQVITPPAAAVAVSGNTQLVIEATPTAGGAFSFTYTLTNDDPDENPYNWTITGTANIAGSDDGADGGDSGSGGCSTGERGGAWWLLASLFALALRILQNPATQFRSAD